MKKRIIISLITVIALVSGIIGARIWQAKEGGAAYVMASDYRDGYLLLPTNYDASGLDLNTDFTLTFEEGVSLTKEELEASLTIEPSLEVTISSDEEGFVIRPSQPLMASTTYRVAIGSITWLFQSHVPFEILGSLPRNQGINVPVNSGIELYFSHSGVEVKDYFEIEPKVKGEFVSYGNTVVFMPKELDPMTLYTVTIKAGLPLKGSTETLLTDYVFKFETEYDTSLNQEQAGYFTYNQLLNDFSTTEQALIPFNYNIYNNEKPGSVKTEVFQYDGVKALEEAFIAYAGTPTWSQYGMVEEVSTKGLKKVLSFDQTLNDVYGYETYIALPEGLEAGFYLVVSKWEEIEFVTFVQVTDLSYYRFGDDVTTYFWVHDLQTDLPAEGASLEGENIQARADAGGLIKVEEAMTKEDGLTTFILSYKEMKTFHYRFPQVTYGIDYYGLGSGSEDYWKYFQTDRSLYKPKDEVAFYGFLKHREDGTYPSKVKVTVKEQRWYYDFIWPGASDSLPYAEVEVDLSGGFYEGRLKLPGLASGSYIIEVSDGDAILVASYLQVENYIKPDYLLGVTKDKEAIFVGETVSFTVNGAFYEGTPVADLAIRYNAYGLDYIDGQGTTDLEGNLTVPYTTNYQPGYQGIVYGGFYATATLPESGELYGDQQVRIFVNDIDVSLKTSLEEGVGTLEGDVHQITLDRLNNHTAVDDQDFLDQVLVGHTFSGVVYRDEWIKEEAGQYYDFINKVVQTRYNYRLETRPYQDISVTSDASGHFTHRITLPKETNVSYRVELETKDLKGRTMTFNQYFYESYEWYGYEGERLSLVGNKETYHVGEAVNLSIKRGESLAEAKSFLVVVGSAGLKEVEVLNGPSYDLVYGEHLVPNMEAVGVLFNGETYETADHFYSGVIIEDYRMDLSVNLDKASYKPGDLVTVTLEATYKDDKGNQVPAKDGVVNLSIVDEALFSLADQELKTLETLYSFISSRMIGFMASHQNNQYEGRLFGGGYGVATDAATEESAMMDKSAPMIAGGESLAYSTNEVRVRSDFRDTALFVNAVLNEEGQGQISFTLPDNVTSWRLSASAISESLKATSKVETVKVSLPFFINTAMNVTYLTGDAPYVVVTGYGSALTSDTDIQYEVTVEETGYTWTLSQKAYEQAYLPLEALEKGTYHVKVRAWTDLGLTDGYEEVIKVVDTYQTVQLTTREKVSPGMAMIGGQEGMTSLIFTDHTRGAILPTLYRLAYGGGKRIDQVLAQSVATTWLNELFMEEVPLEEVDMSSYQLPSGALTLLPYSDEDAEVTAYISGWLKDPSMKQKAIGYLYNAYYTSRVENQGMLLFGLAASGESVLPMINTLEAVENLSLRNRLYVALAYKEMGDTYKAQQLFETYFAKDLDQYEEVARYVGSEAVEDNYKISADLMMLVTDFDADLALKLSRYVLEYETKTHFTGLQMLAMAEHFVKTLSVEDLGFTYTYLGTTYEESFDNGYSMRLYLPSENLKEFEVVSVKGNVDLVARYNGISANPTQDPNLSLSQRFYDYETGNEKGNFKVGDIVKVVIDYKIDGAAIDYGYVIRAFAPSGLVPILGTNRFGIEPGIYNYYEVDGQEVTFGAGRDEERYEPKVYYARVISPGAFKADGPLMFGYRYQDSYYQGTASSITIEP